MISGPSGSGKTTLIETLVQETGFRRVITATTRAPRVGEVPGRDYRFLSRAEFESLRDEDGLLEWAEVHGQLYGTPRSEISGPESEWVFLVIDVQGHRSLRSRQIPLTSIFIKANSLDELERRLARRNTESKADIARRLARAHSECAAESEYDHVVVNERVEDACRQIRQILLGSAPLGAPPSPLKPTRSP